MTFELYTKVVLTRDVPDSVLRKGDIGLVVEYLPASASRQEDGYILEFFDAVGNTIDVVPVLGSALEKPRANTVLTYRTLDEAA
jgi:hypothetical protein